MKIGISTLVYWNRGKESLNLEKVIPRISDLGFEAAEIHCEDPVLEGWSENKEKSKKEVKDVLSTVDLEASVHGPFDSMNLATLNDKLGEEILRQMKESVKFAGYIGSDVIVIHPGHVSSKKYKKEACLNASVERLRELAEIGEDLSVRVCMENMANVGRELGRNIPEIKKIIRRVNHGNLKLTLDLAHANTTDSGPVKFARELKDYVGHLHVSDNTGKNFHSLVGEGDINFRDAFRELQPYDGKAIIEGWIHRDEAPFVKLEKEKLEKIIEGL